MAWVVRCRRTDPAGSSAALVAAWLIDAMAGIDVRLNCADAESVVLDVAPAQGLPVIRAVLDRALAEPRFAGWQVLFE
ncbi:MAG: hypothetical protein ACJ74U_05085 [Jatrophihabitantaceae bacterium]